MRGGLVREPALWSGGEDLSLRRIEHVASFGGLKTAPTDANTFVTAALFEELRRWTSRRKEDTAVRVGGSIARLESTSRHGLDSSTWLMNMQWTQAKWLIDLPGVENL
jgi:hypothetical protein